MKMFYGNVPVDSMKIKHYEISTNDCTAIPSDLQSGVTCVSKGKKITGTGKSFEFANYGELFTNVSTIIPNMINIIEIASLDYPLQISIALIDMQDIDFSVSQTLGNIIIDEISYPINAIVSDNKMTISCDKTIKLQVFFGRDNYV